MNKAQPENMSTVRVPKPSHVLKPGHHAFDCKLVALYLKLRVKQQEHTIVFLFDS